MNQLAVIEKSIPAVCKKFKRLSLLLVAFLMLTESSYANCYSPRFYIGLNAKLFVTDPLTDEAVRARNDMVMAAGVTFTFYSPTWKELEPQPGVYQFASLDTMIARAQSYRLPIYFNLKIIDSNQRQMPDDLMSRSFDDPQVQARLTSLINAMVPRFKGMVRLAVLGNEVNMYLKTHQNEAPAYVTLYKTGAARLKALIPGINVSATLTMPIFYVFPAYLVPLRNALDYMSVTYYPLGENYQVNDPGVAAVTKDFSYIKANANGKRILFQEIGYPSSPLNGSSEAKQAQFIANCLSILKTDPVYLGANVMIMADLSDALAAQYAGYYGENHPAFIAYIKTIGLFTDQGKPKLAWKTFYDVTLSLKKSFYTGCDSIDPVTVFPNPWMTNYHAGSTVTLEQIPAGQVLKIYNPAGQIVRQFTGANGPVPWDLTNQTGQPLPTGAYFAVYAPGQNPTRFVISR